jgi:cysteinyl-tRNA synthetase
MIDLHPEFLTKNGQEFAILPYEEFVKIQELLLEIKKKEVLITNNNTGSNRDALSEKIEESKRKSLNQLTKVINQIKSRKNYNQVEKIREFLFHDCYELGDDDEQKETLEIIESLEEVSI